MAGKRPDHNLFLGTVETRENDFAGTALPYSMLDDLLDSIPARQKLLLIDACESGLTDPTVLSTRKSDPGVAVFLETLEMFTDLNRGTGTVTIGSTTGYTKAVEWPKLGNSAFFLCIAPGPAQTGRCKIQSWRLRSKQYSNRL